MTRNTFFRKMLSVLLAAALLAALAIPSFAADYADLEGHWAKSYMEDLAGKGLLTGYNDNTMRPENNMTIREALVMLSRVFEMSDSAAAYVEKDYGAAAAAVNGSGADWAIRPIAVCFAGSVTLADELRSLNLSGNISREYLALLVTRVLGLMVEARNAEAFPGFTDLDEIREDCRGAVAVLYEIGVVTGDSAGSFRPKNDIKRAEVAALISRALSYAAKEGKTFTLSAYEGLTESSGVIASAAPGRLIVRDADGQQREYAATSETAVTLDGSAAALGSALEGCYATVRERSRVAVQIAVNGKTERPVVQGTITAMLAATDGYRISVLADGAEASATYNVPTNVAVELNGAASKFTSLSKGQRATVWLENGAAAKIVCNTKTVEKTGSVLSMNIDSQVVLRIRDLDGAIWRYDLDIGNMPRIERNGSAITIDRLSVDDTVTVTSANGAVTGIRADLSFSENAVSGLLSSVATTLNGTVWTIQASNEAFNYYVTKTTTAYNSGGKIIPLDNVKVGDHVKVIVSGDTIVEVSQQAATLSVEKISGRVLNVDTDSQTVTLLTTDSKLVYVGCASIGGIVSSLTGRQVSISNLSVNDNLLIYGRAAANNFAATLVILEV